MNVGERLKTAIYMKNKTLKEFSKKSNIPYTTLQQYFSGVRKPNADVLYNLTLQSDISIDWLLTGKGSMFKSEQINQPPEWLNDWWQQADEKHRAWLEIQLSQTPPTTQ